MTNFEKCRQELKIEDIGNGSFCQAIHRVRNEDNCGPRSCEECRKWLKQEYKPQILDKVEKKYLSNIVRPFRDKVEYIQKSETCSREYIKIEIKNEASINLPFFTKGTMYKGMKANTAYTLEELKLYDELPF